jgi:hypothetical protein
VRTELESKHGIPYEKGVSYTFWIKGTVVEVIKGIEPLPEVVGIWTVVVLIDEGGGGGTTLPPVAVGMGVWGLPDEVAIVSSIVAHWTNYRSGEVIARGTTWIRSGVDKLVIRGFVGLKPSVSRSKTIDSSGAGKYSLGAGSDTVSYGTVASNEPSWSILHLNGGEGGSKVTSDKP